MLLQDRLSFIGPEEFIQTFAMKDPLENHKVRVFLAWGDWGRVKEGSSFKCFQELLSDSVTQEEVACFCFFF